MRRTKGLVLIFLVMLSLFCAISLLLPSKITVSKSIEINAPKAGVALQIRDLEKWKNWYPSFNDSNITIKTLGAENVEVQDENGQKFMLTLERSSADTINITSQVPGKKPVLYQFILMNGSGDGTLLLGNINYDLGRYPWQRLQGLLMDKVMGEQFAVALENLKKFVERNH